MSSLNLIECPRDAMQGIHEFIPTEIKINYINSLLKCGFDTIDFGSFVSPKAIPQLRDTAEVLSKLNLNDSSSKLLAIIANERGAIDACNFEEINYLGFPFSVSETFQQRNTNSSIEASLLGLEKIKTLADKSSKQLVVYLSMAFGNPYGDDWNADLVIHWANRLHNELGINILAVSDTIGSSTGDSISYLFSNLIPALPNVEFGAHLHTKYEETESKLKAAYDAGCRRFDSAVKGYGGCPMAGDDLTGNMPTEKMLEYFLLNGYETKVNPLRFQDSLAMSPSVFL
jgi:hydroxymethylglutaryl-CoA lyase